MSMLSDSTKIYRLLSRYGPVVRQTPLAASLRSMSMACWRFENPKKEDIAHLTNLLRKFPHENTVALVENFPGFCLVEFPGETGKDRDILLKLEDYLEIAIPFEKTMVSPEKLPVEMAAWDYEDPDRAHNVYLVSDLKTFADTHLQTSAIDRALNFSLTAEEIFALSGNPSIRNSQLLSRFQSEYESVQFSRPEISSLLEDIHKLQPSVEGDSTVEALQKLELMCHAAQHYGLNLYLDPVN